MITCVKPVLNPAVRGLCIRPYPGHPRGCPNWNERHECPPIAPMLGDVWDLEKPVYLICNAFDFKAHTDRMREKHSEWSDRQVECCRYWQGTARKQLRTKVKSFPHEGMRVLYCPEACGVDVTATMAIIGIAMEWPPKTVALVGTQKHGEG